ncbi:MAG: hypothetical protein E5299_01563 [Burkholderia gladioli]|nr:MAG: hypothetical protein E5299_01563 [Burkholderia gladioli]
MPESAHRCIDTGDYVWVWRRVACVCMVIRLSQALLGVKTVYRLTLRALQGFTQSLRDLTFPSLPVPNYTTLFRRENA